VAFSLEHVDHLVRALHVVLGDLELMRSAGRRDRWGTSRKVAARFKLASWRREVDRHRGAAKPRSIRALIWS
jgi:hypothetical protein